MTDEDPVVTILAIRSFVSIGGEDIEGARTLLKLIDSPINAIKSAAKSALFLN